MSLEIGHFAAGASTALLAVNLVPPQIRRKAVSYGFDPGFAAILAGLWAMFPDAAVFVGRLKAFHESAWANICFFHYTLDRLDVNNSIWVSVGLVGLMLIFMLTLWVGDFWYSRGQG